MGLVIAGFHRSGTSSVAQHLTQSGLNLGSDLYGANEFNLYGYFEDRAPVEFHDKILRSAGLDWASVTDEDIPMTEEDTKFIRKYSAYRECEAAVWGFKDPRVCQFMNYWMENAPSLQALIVYRSPVESCWSLYRRAARSVIREEENGPQLRILNNQDHALALWVTHNKKLLDTVRRYPDRTIVIGHASFIAGHNIAMDVRDHLGINLRPADVDETFDPDVLTRGVSPLPVSNSELLVQAKAVWNELRAHDTEGQKYCDEESCNLYEESNDMELKNILAGMQLSAAKEFINDLRVENLKYKKRLRNIDNFEEKIKKRPFTLFFLKKMGIISTYLI